MKEGYVEYLFILEKLTREIIANSHFCKFNRDKKYNI